MVLFSKYSTFDISKTLLHKFLCVLLYQIGLSNLFRVVGLVAQLRDMPSSSYAPQTQTHLQIRQLVHHSESVRKSPLFRNISKK